MAIGRTSRTWVSARESVRRRPASGVITSQCVVRVGVTITASHPTPESQQVRYSPDRRFDEMKKHLNAASPPSTFSGGPETAA
jgi:hypothetical protein